MLAQSAWSAGLISVFLLSSLSQAQSPAAMEITIAKGDMARFVGTLPCAYEENLCPQAMQGFTSFGLQGEPGFEDLAALPKDPASGRMPIILGFNESRAFDLAKFSFDAPTKGRKFIVLNELSSNEANHAMLTEWKVTSKGYTLVRILPEVYELALGEMSVAGKPVMTAAGMLVLLRGLGSDAGLNVQDYRVVRISKRGEAQVIAQETNRSEAPVAEILSRLNDDQAAEEVIDSALTCVLVKTGKTLKCTKAMTQVRYSKAGTTENPIGKNDYTVEISKPGASKR